MVAQTWFETFVNHVQTNNVDGIISQLVDDIFWRDILTLTWDFRTFFGSDRTRRLLVDRIAATKLSKLQLDTKSPPTLQRPYPDVAWIQALFTFSTAVGTGSGLLRLHGRRRGLEGAHNFHTLETLHGFSELSGPLPEQEQSTGRGQNSGVGNARARSPTRSRPYSSSAVASRDLARYTPCVVLGI